MRVPTGPLEGSLTSVRLATDGDAALLTGWHSDPEIARYWDDEVFTLEEVGDRLARSDVDAYIVEESGQPIGYLHAWFDSPAEGERCGLDMFLVPSARDRGLGPDAAMTLTRWLLGAGHAEVTVDPYVANDRAVAAWKKAGFRIVEQRPMDGDHREAWYLMVARSTDISPA